MSKKEDLAETVEYWRRTRPLHECHGGFETPQTESALVRVLNAIDVVIVDNNKTTNDKVSPVRQTRLAELTHACWLESASNLTNLGLGETYETYRRSLIRYFL